MQQSWFGIPLALAAATLAGCTATIEGHDRRPGATPPGGTDPGGPGGGGGAGPDPARPGDPPDATRLSSAPVVRRLNRVEYDNTVRDLLGDVSKPATAFPPDESAHGFDNQGAALTVPPLLAERLLTSAETLARTAVGNLSSLLPCAAAADDACARSFVVDFGQRAFRRPLAPEEVTRHLQVFAAAKAQGDFKTGIEVVLRAMLISPHFIFRIETGVDRSRPTPWELASRLSYFLWESMPDGPLFAAARSGALENPTTLVAQAERMLADPRAAATLARFHTQWLRLQPLEAGTLQKDAKIFPKWKATIAPLLHREATALLADAVGQGAGGFAALFTGGHTFANGPLAAYYGISGPSGETFARVTVDEPRRAGILARGGLMAALAHHNQSSPTLRGKFVREALLCEELPPPPPTVNNVLSDPSPSQTTRERLSQHAKDASCAGCHAAIDPIGLAFESFDGIGLHRTTESGKAIDLRGEVTGASDVAGPFTGAAELGGKLARSAQARACFATQWLRFALGRGEAPEDAATRKRLADELGRNGDIEAMLLAIVQTPQFTRRGGTP